MSLKHKHLVCRNLLCISEQTHPTKQGVNKILKKIISLLHLTFDPETLLKLVSNKYDAEIIVSCDSVHIRECICI